MLFEHPQLQNCEAKASHASGFAGSHPRHSILEDEAVRRLRRRRELPRCPQEDLWRRFPVDHLITCRCGAHS